MQLQDGEILISASDLSAHLGCGHRTQLDRRAALGTLQRPPHDPMLEVLQARGLAHEKAYIEHLKTQRALKSVDLRGTPLDAQGMQETRRAMHAGVDLIIQAPLVSGRLRGFADVLLRVQQPSPELGTWSYLVVDTKLASETRAGTVLQLCLYTRIVGEIQGVPPGEFWVVSPGRLGEPERFRTTDYAAFARRVERQLREAIERALPPEERVPEPVNECDICRWWSCCDRRRREVDHLSFVAGIRRLQRRELERRGIHTLAALAGASMPFDPQPLRGSAESYARVHHQARLQRDSRGTTPIVELLPRPEPQEDGAHPLGLARLPEPSPGDVFLDLEGDPFIEGGGLEYLFGWASIDERGKPAYAARWALDAAAEKAAFEHVIDAFMARWDDDPGFSIYHFGAYETAAFKRLMGRHVTRAEELDRLLRGGRFVDLHTIVRQSLRIGVEKYGLKQLEAVHGYERDLALREASLHKMRLERALELGTPGDAPEGAAEAVERYNRDDCISTWRLREWLEQKRSEQTRAGAALPRPLRDEGQPSEVQEERSAEVQALMNALLDGIPAEPELRSPEGRARFILAHLLEWHRREAKATWWEFFRLADLPPAALRDEKNGLAGLKHIGRTREGKKLPIDRYEFAPQEHEVRPERTLHVTQDQELGTVTAIDLEARTIDVKKRRCSVDLHPEAVFVHDNVPAKPIPEALMRVAGEIARNGIDAPGRFRAARELLLGRPPRLRSGPTRTLARDGESTRQSAERLALDLDESVLPIQGPPGTGKTHTGARVVCALVRAGQKVGITGPSHKVIRNLLDEVVRAANEEGLTLRILQRVRTGEAQTGGAIQESAASDCLATALAQGEVDVAAGTPWAWAREDTEALVDTLVIDEAGQLSLANALGAATAARNVILLGDPQQLEQPLQGTHPEGCATSALQHLLGAHDTIPPDRGLFLDTTWRLHPAICAFTSELFYEDRLAPHAQCGRQALVGPMPLAGAGLWLHTVEHEGNTSSSPEEVQAIASLVRELVRPGIGWIDFDGVERALTYADLRIVSPYNAQVAALRIAIPEARDQIGTVDRFQGQEAPVVIYSMTTSSTEEAPRGLEFLFSLNRFNVATSRARCACIVVASRALLEAECRTPRQIKLVNALCRYEEMARQIE